MGQIDVYWLSYHEDALARGYWDNGLLEDIFAQGNYNHIEVKNKKFPKVPKGRGGIVIVNGRTHVKDTQKINNDIANLAWVVFIDTGDEEASFPWREIKHPMMRVWIMLPRMNEHNDTSFKLVNGYRTGTKQILDKYKVQPKVLDWFFCGQVNHARREQCVEQLRELPNGMLVETSGFGQEVMNQETYLTNMANAKIALCPSGIESPDNFRLYEALEAGCLPVVDAFATNNQSFGFWQYLFGENPPFPVVSYWDELPRLMPTLLREWPHNANKAFAWWQQHKRKIKLKLEEDVRILHG